MEVYMENPVRFRGHNFFIHACAGHIRLYSRECSITIRSMDERMLCKFFVKGFRDWLRLRVMSSEHLKVGRESPVPEERAHKRLIIMNLPVILSEPDSPEPKFSSGDDIRHDIRLMRMETARLTSLAYELVQKASEKHYASRPSGREVNSTKGERLASACLAQATTVTQGMEVLCRLLELLA